MDLSLINHKVIVTERKKELIELRSVNPFLNFKIISKKELIEKFFFSYDNRTKLFLSRMNFKLENTEEILQSLYFLKSGISSKVDNLIDIRNQLDDSHLLIKNDIFKKYLLSQDILVYGYDRDDPELNNIFNLLGIKPYFYCEKIDVKQLNMFEFTVIDDEIRYVFEKISLFIKDGIALNKIKIVTENQTYINELKKYEHFYSFKFNIKSNDTLFLTDDYKLLKSYLQTTFFEEAFSLVYSRVNYKKEFDKLLDKYIEVKDYIRVEEVDSYLDYIAKSIKLDSIEYENGISVVSLRECNKDDYVLLIGFVLNSYPVIYKDEDYLSNIEKNLLNISDSKYKQVEAENEIIRLLLSLDNVYLSYSKKNDNEVYYPSLIQEKLGISIEKYVFSNVIYSQEHFNLFMGKIIDEYENFSFVSPYLKSVSKSELNYLSYSNKFTGVNLDLSKLKLSATAIDLYYKCAFHYYLSKILYLDSFEENLSTKIGNICHKILEKIVKDEFVSIAEVKNEFSLTPKENVIVNALNSQIEKMIDNFVEFKNNTLLKDMMSEDFNFSYRISDKSVLEGRIDLIVSNSDNFAILDYKTSSTQFEKKYVPFGYSLQLPIYYLLTKEGNSHFVEKDFLGFYIHNVINVDFYKNKYDYLLFNGITTCDKGFSLINKDFIKRYNRQHIAISEKDFANIIDTTKKKVEEATDNILSNHFDINPKMINQNDTSCLYCPFNNICYHTYKDYMYLSSKEQE